MIMERPLVFNKERLENIIRCSNLSGLVAKDVDFTTSCSVLHLYYLISGLHNINTNSSMQHESIIKSLLVNVPVEVLSYIHAGNDQMNIVSIEGLDDILKTKPATSNGPNLRSRKRSRDVLQLGYASIKSSVELCCSILGIDSDECIVAQNGFLVPKTSSNEMKDLDSIVDGFRNKFKTAVTIKIMEDNANWTPRYDGSNMLDIVFGKSKPGYGYKFSNTFATQLLPDPVALVEYLNDYMFVVNKPYQYWFRIYNEEKHQEHYLSTLKDKFSDKAVAIWLRSDQKRKFVMSDFIIDDQQVDKDVFNMYVRPPMLDIKDHKTLETLCPIIHDYLKRVVSGGDNERYEYILKWLAKMWKYGKTGICLVLLGKKGTGKSTFIQLASAIIGKEYYSSLENIHDLNSQFNYQLHRNILIGIEEVGDGAFKNRVTQNKLKAYITEPSIRFEKKGMQCFTGRNSCSFIACSNYSSPVDVTEDNRRFTIFEISDCEMQKSEYFADLLKELNDQTIIQKLRFYLYHMLADTGELLPVLHTPEEKELKRSCKPPSDTFVQQFVTDGMVYRSAVTDYQNWAQENGTAGARETDFQKSLKKYGFETRRNGKNNLTCIFRISSAGKENEDVNCE